MPANGDRIDRSDLDGKNIESPIKLGKGDFLGNADTRGEFWGMDVDSKAGFIYWVDRSYENVARANLDGSHVEEIVLRMRHHTGSNLALDSRTDSFTGPTRTHRRLDPCPEFDG